LLGSGRLLRGSRQHHPDDQQREDGWKRAWHGRE